MAPTAIADLLALLLGVGSRFLQCEHWGYSTVSRKASAQFPQLLACVQLAFRFKFWSWSCCLLQRPLLWWLSPIICSHTGLITATGDHSRPAEPGGCSRKEPSEARSCCLGTERSIQGRYNLTYKQSGEQDGGVRSHSSPSGPLISPRTETHEQCTQISRRQEKCLCYYRAHLAKP